MKLFQTGEIILNTYEVLELLNSGGMGNVYKAKHLKIPKVFAIKQLKLDQYKSLFIGSFISEISILRSLKHPNISKFYDSFYFNDNFFYVMEFIEGEDIKTFFKNNPDLSEERILKYFIMSLNAIDYLHSKSIIHRDIKPSNVLIDFKKDMVKIIDFGISNFLNRNIVFVSPGYSPPEQYHTFPPKPYNDIFSLGMTFLEALSCQKPYEQKNTFDREIHKKYVENAVEKIKNKVSQSFLDIILKCVESEPEKRFQQISEIMEKLRSEKFTIDNTYLIEFNNYLEYVEKVFQKVEETFREKLGRNLIELEIEKSVDMMVIKIFDMNQLSIFLIFDLQEILVYVVPYLSKGFLAIKADMQKVGEDELVAELLKIAGYNS